MKPQHSFLEQPLPTHTSIFACSRFNDVPRDVDVTEFRPANFSVRVDMQFRLGNEVTVDVASLMTAFLQGVQQGFCAAIQFEHMPQF